MEAATIINTLNLQPHPEGGYFKETYRSAGIIPAAALPSFTGDRYYSTSIYYLLGRGDFSAFHRIRSDEGWHFYSGGTLLIHQISPGGQYLCTRLGSNLEAGEQFQHVVPAGYWFASEPSPAADYALVGCTVSPGFDFDDFEMGKKEELQKLFPFHTDIINRLCRQ